MNSFVSTRSPSTGRVSFADALGRGLAPDGGLYVPAEVTDLPGRPPHDPDFSDTALWMAEGWLGDTMTQGALSAVVRDAFDFSVPLVEVEPGVHVLELFHGPSLAFKDVGARFMARAMAEMDDGRRLRTVLVATSGDTGGAVAAAFHGLEGFRVVVLFPAAGISERQRRQMTTLGGNVLALAVDGTFDDCQRLAKGAFTDADLSEACGLTSANSINVGRLLPQAFYYAHAALLLGWDARPATFVVPSGNLGNLCAGLLARRAGMPAAGFVAACNPNRPFLDYLETGVVRPRPSVRSVSNAMDVGDPSNLERIRWLYDDDVERLRSDVHGVGCDDAETRDCMARVHRRTGYVLDPHTAVGWVAMEKARLPGDTASPWVVLATAHPAKFPEVVEKATGARIAPPHELTDTFDRPESMVPIDAEPAVLAHLLLDGVTA